MAATLKNNNSVVRWADLVAGLLLLAAMVIASARLVSTDWVEELNILPMVVILGTLAGLALGYSRFSGVTAFFFSLAYGVFVVFWRLGSTMGAAVPWNERIISVSGRLQSTITQLSQGQDVYDSILFLTAMAFLFWLLSSHAGYSLFRHGDAWSAILPTGATMFIIHINDKFWPFRAWYLGIFLVLALMLIARMAYLRLRLEWQQTRTRTPTYIGLDMSRAALLATVPLILIAWTAPALAKGLPSAQTGWQEISQPVRDQIDHMFASLKATVGIVGDYYSDTLSLGRGNVLSDVVVMTIEAPTIRPTGVRYYWKARTFDYYGESGWATTLNSSQEIGPSIFDQQLAESEYRWNAEMTFQTNIPLRTLHTVSETYSISRPGNATVLPTPDGGYDVHVLEADPYLRGGEVYEIRAALTSASIAELREAGTDYPQWVLDRYLQLPDNITERTKQLAAQVVDGLDTPYDQAEAITNFLRENIEYSERIDAPPSNQERIDWLLFDYRQGFCNYYATAEIVMLRSLGIPARMAVGYGEGEGISELDLAALPPGVIDIPEGEQESLVADTSTYTIRQRDLHAWPEVYFPGIGWVEFEPTVSELPIFRPSGLDLGTSAAAQTNRDRLDPLSDADVPQNDTSDLLPEIPVVTPQQRILQATLRVVLVLAGVGLLVLALWGIRRRLPPEPIAVQLENRFRRMGIRPPRVLVEWARRASLSPLTKSYLEINRALRRLGKSPAGSDTPAERVHALQELLPATTEPSSYLLDEYQSQLYSPRPANGVQQARSASRQIRNQSLWAWFNRLISRWQEPGKRRER